MAYSCYFNGDFYPADAPLLQVSDLGLLRGYGLFDYFRTYNGIPFRFGEYWERFTRSAKLLHLEVPVSGEEALEVIRELHRLSGEQEVACRMVLTGGYAPDGVHVVAPNFLVRAEPLPLDNPQSRQTGIKVLSYPYLRDLPEIKSTNYVHMIRMAGEMRRQGAADLLYHQNGLVSELTRSNVLLFKGDTLVTPERNVLKGITRKFALELAQGHFDVALRDITLEELLQADELFTTSTTKWVMPIVQVGDALIGNGQAGSRTLYLQQRMIAALQAYEG